MNSDPAVLVHVAACTHKGLVRERNEDAVALDNTILAGAADFSIARAFGTESAHVLMIADGMGGHPHGDVASREALTFMSDRAAGCGDASSWVDMLHAANDRLYDLMDERRETLGMGTTAVGVVLDGAGVVSFNIGDSRAYRHDGRELRLLTCDDVPSRHARIGIGRASHAVTQSLGGRTFRTAVLPHVSYGAPLRPGESLLVCSDGLTDMVAEWDLARTLSDVPDPTGCARALLRLALDAGGKDNVSVIVARAVGEERVEG